MAKRREKQSEAREKYVEVTLSDVEWETITAKARALGMSRAGFLRTAALERAGRVAMV